ncbi:MAG: hypothetical protein QW328_08040 [Nitrososphaerota archaeon]
MGGACVLESGGGVLGAKFISLGGAVFLACSWKVSGCAAGEEIK